MNDEYRLTFLRELVATGLTDDVYRQVMGVVDRLGSAFDIKKRCTSIVPIESTYQYALVEYLACKTLEGYSKETIANYRTTVGKFLSSIKKPVSTICTNDIRAYLCQYQSVRGVSNRTLDKIRTTIAGFFHWAKAEGKIERDPSEAIRPIKFIVKPKPSLSQINLEYIRKCLGGARERAIVEMMYSTGCRVSELCNMKRSDVDMENLTVLIFGKGGKYRTGFLNAKAYVALNDYLAQRTDRSEYLFVSERKPHDRLKRAAVEKIVRSISDRAYMQTGVHVTPHTFRHTTVTTALRNGMALQNVSKMVGHSEVKTTMYYAQIDTSDVRHDHMKYVC